MTFFIFVSLLIVFLYASRKLIKRAIRKISSFCCPSCLSETFCWANLSSRALSDVNVVIKVLQSTVVMQEVLMWSILLNHQEESLNLYMKISLQATTTWGNSNRLVAEISPSSKANRSFFSRSADMIQMEDFKRPDSLIDYDQYIRRNFRQSSNRWQSESFDPSAA